MREQLLLIKQMIQYFKSKLKAWKDHSKTPTGAKYFVWILEMYMNLFVLHVKNIKIKLFTHMYYYIRITYYQNQGLMTLKSAF